VNIAVLTLATANIASYSRFSLVNKLCYAQLHGYDFFHYTAVLDESRPAAWSKIRIIQNHLPAYDWVFWTDADSLIMNQSISLQHILRRADSHNMILTPGPRDKFNTGQWLVRSCEWSATLLEQIWDEVTPSDSWFWRNPWEQRALAELVERDSELANYICILSMRDMNSRPERAFVDLCPELKGLDYEPGDFIVHFYHTKCPDLRLRGMRKYYLDWRRSISRLTRRGLLSNADSFNGGYKWTARKPAKSSGQRLSSNRPSA
jgi:hypothetical protein